MQIKGAQKIGKMAMKRSMYPKGISLIFYRYWRHAVWYRYAGTSDLFLKNIRLNRKPTFMITFIIFKNTLNRSGGRSKKRGGGRAVVTWVWNRINWSTPTPFWHLWLYMYSKNVPNFCELFWYFRIFGLVWQKFVMAYLRYYTLKWALTWCIVLAAGTKRGKGGGA